MGVAVLNPRDCLKNPSSPKTLVSSPPHMRRPRTPNLNRANRPQPSRRFKPSQARSKDASLWTPAMPMVLNSSANNKLNMSQVKILKRGEELTDIMPDPPSPKATVKENRPNNMDLATPVRPGSVPEPNQAVGFYAGSSMCIVSPPPSSLPLPAFFTKKSVVSTNVEATSFLLKALRLNLQ